MSLLNWLSLSFIIHNYTLDFRGIDALCIYVMGFEVVKCYGDAATK